MTFDRVKELREDNDIIQTAIAEYLNIKRNTYSDYETGKINIPIDALIKIADYHNVSLDYLVGRSDDKSPFREPDQTNRRGATP